MEVGSRGYVAKSFGFALQKLGLKQDAIKKLRKAISLICMRCSYSIYLTRKNEIWRPWEAQHFQLKIKHNKHPTDNGSAIFNKDAEVFCGFGVREIQETFKENHRRINILCSGLNDSNAFKGFESSEVSNFAKVNKNRMFLLKGAKSNKANIPLDYNPVFPKTPGLINPGDKIRPSAINNQSSKKRAALP